MGLITPKASKKREEELAQISQKSKKARLSITDLIIPIASGALFIVLSFAVVAGEFAGGKDIVSVHVAQRFDTPTPPAPLLPKYKWPIACPASAWV